jgi:hypothetical protein
MANRCQASLRRKNTKKTVDGPQDAIRYDTGHTRRHRFPNQAKKSLGIDKTRLQETDAERREVDDCQHKIPAP